jgi:hypothetical protein
LFIQQIQPTSDSKILDVGFSNEEWLSGDNYLEKHYPYPHNITALGVCAFDLFQKRYPQVTAVRYDGKIFPFPDNSFEIGWSNAVIEHVGEEEAQTLFLKELRRTCRKVYLTTPNRYFPFELHTKIPLLHWLPKKIFDKILSHTTKRWATGDFMYLLSERQVRTLLKKAGIENYRIYRNRFMGFTMDFSILFP